MLSLLRRRKKSSGIPILETMDDYDDVSHDSDSLPDVGLMATGGAIETKENEFTIKAGTAYTPAQYTPSMTLQEQYTFERLEDSRNLQVIPTEINFDSIDSGTLYVMTFAVLNCSGKAQRIRVKAPESMFFALNYVPTGVIAPGMEARGEIECQLHEGSDVRIFDKIVVSMGDNLVTVPIVATKLSPDIRFEPFLNMGFVAEGQQTTMEVAFENFSTMSGTTTLQASQDTRLTVKPMKFELAAGERQVIQISYEGKDLGPWREMIEVNTAGAVESQFLDIAVQTVNQKLTLLAENNQGIMEACDFGTLFYGTERGKSKFKICYFFILVASYFTGIGA